MSNLINHAKKELELAGLFSEDKDFYGGMTGTAVMELIEVFSKQGHSGMSAGIVIQIFSKLANFKNINPITGEDDEWNHIGEWDDGYSGPMYQNKRCSGVFKYEDGTCTYNSDVIKTSPNGTTWSGPLYPTKEDAINNTNKLKFKIKSYPFTPKTFYIDVNEEEIEKDDWIMWVKDPKQLDDVYDYYDKITE